MKINKSLLPLKAHFFFNAAGVSIITPFVPVIAKQLGFSPVSVGWALTVSPLMAVIFKPLLGAFADKTKHKKLLFIFLILFSAICGFCVKWINPIYAKSTALLCSDGDLYIAKICRQVLKEESYRDQLNSLKTSVTCEVSLPVYNFNGNIANHKNVSLYNRAQTKFTVAFAQIENISATKDGCAYLSLEFTNETNSYISLPNCSKTMDTVGIQCNDPFLYNAFKAPLEDLAILSRREFWLLLLFTVGNYIGFSASNSLGDAITFNLLGEKPGNYGMQRAWGSVGWGIFSVVIGLIVDKLSEGKLEIDYSVSYYMMMSLILIDVLITLKLQVKIVHKSESIKKDVIKLFKKPEVIISGFWCFTIGFLFSYLWNFLFWFLEDLAQNSGKITKSWIKTLEGALQLVQCTGEAPFIFYSGIIIKWLGHKNSMVVVLFGFSARFLCYTLLTNPWWILPIELLNGITFGLFYPTMTSYASAIAPKGTEATIQNIFSCLYEGIGSATGSFTGGYLVEYVGLRGAFLILGTMSSVLAILLMIVHHFIATMTDEKSIPDEEEREMLNMKKAIIQKMST